MADTAVLFLLQQVVQNAVFGVQVGVDVHLAHIAEEIEVEVIHPALLQLFFKDLPHLAHVAKVIAGKLVGQVEFVPGIGGQSLADGQLRCAGVVGPGSVIVVYASLHSQGHHFLHGGLVYHSIIPIYNGKAHAAQPQVGEL